MNSWNVDIEEYCIFFLFDTSYKVNKASSVTKDFSRIVSKICCINSFSMLRFGLWGIPVFYLKFCTYVQEWDRNYFFSWYCLVWVLRLYWPHRLTWGMFPLSGKLFGKSQLFCEILWQNLLWLNFLFFICLFIFCIIPYNTPLRPNNLIQRIQNKVFIWS